jgi:hypothetical protein
MPKFRLYVTGTKDMGYEVAAHDKYEAASIAESLFEDEFHETQWSGIDVWNTEEQENESRD